MNARQLSRIALAMLSLAAPMLVGGCSSSRTFVLQQPMPGTVHTGLTLRPLDGAVKVDPEAQKDFETKLSAKFKDQIGVAPSNHGDLVVQYRFTLFDQGAGAARVGSTIANIVGSPFYGIGDGAVGVEVVYSTADGKHLV